MKYDAARPCPKCGGQFVLTRFRNGYGQGYGGELIWRTCERCQYQWSEEPLDAASGQEGK